MAGRLGVCVVAGPGIESGVLEGTGEGESDGPREGFVLNNGGKIVSSLLWGLTAREEDDAGEFARDMIFKSIGGEFANFFGSGLFFVFFASEDHVAFKNAGA